MKLYQNTHTRRHAASVLLLLWLFAIGSGVANACLLDAHVAYPAAVVAGAVQSVHAAGSALDHSDALADHDCNPDAPLAPCLRVCDDSSKSLPKQQTGLDQGHSAPALLIAVLWGAAAPQAPMAGSLDARLFAPPGPPIRVRFARLAL